MGNEHSPISQLVKSVKLATPVNPSPVKFDHTFAGAANSCDTLRGHYSISWPSVYLESWPQLQV